VCTIFFCVRCFFFACAQFSFAYNFPFACVYFYLRMIFSCVCVYFYSHALVAIYTSISSLFCSSRWHLLCFCVGIVTSISSFSCSSRSHLLCFSDLSNEIFKLARHSHVHCAWLGSCLHVRVLGFHLDRTAETSRPAQHRTALTAKRKAHRTQHVKHSTVHLQHCKVHWLPSN
jgi:hypothetical protein